MRGDKELGLALKREGDLVGGDCAFAENHPGVTTTGEIDDGGGNTASGRAAIDDEGQLVAELFPDSAGRGALRQAGEIGRGRSDGETEALDDCAGNGGFGDTEGEIAGVGSNSEGKFGASLDDDGERARPEAFRQAIKGGVDLAGEFVGLGSFGNEEREWLVAGAGFELVDAVDGAEIDRIDGEPVEGVRGQSDNVAVVKTGGNIVDERGLWLVGMDTESFCRQNSAPGPTVGRERPVRRCTAAISHLSTLDAMAQWRVDIVDLISRRRNLSVTTLHQITPQMALSYKSVRLRALQDTPSAFGSTYLRESAFTDEEWNVRARNLDGRRAVGYLAFDQDAHWGIAACFLDEVNPLKAHLVSMWVAPEYRKEGVGRLLVEAIAAWAKGRGAQDLQLMVTSGNHAAIEFYKRIGFSMTGRTEPYPNDPAMIEYEMVRALSSN